MSKSKQKKAKAKLVIEKVMVCDENSKESSKVEAQGLSVSTNALLKATKRDTKCRHLKELEREKKEVKKRKEKMKHKQHSQSSQNSAENLIHVNHPSKSNSIEIIEVLDSDTESDFDGDCKLQFPKTGIMTSGCPRFIAEKFSIHAIDVVRPEPLGVYISKTVHPGDYLMRGAHMKEFCRFSLVPMDSYGHACGFRRGDWPFGDSRCQCLTDYEKALHRLKFAKRPLTVYVARPHQDLYETEHYKQLPGTEPYKQWLQIWKSSQDHTQINLSGTNEIGTLSNGKKHGHCFHERTGSIDSFAETSAQKLYSNTQELTRPSVSAKAPSDSTRAPADSCALVPSKLKSQCIRPVSPESMKSLQPVGESKCLASHSCKRSMKANPLIPKDIAAFDTLENSQSRLVASKATTFSLKPKVDSVSSDRIIPMSVVKEEQVIYSCETNNFNENGCESERPCCGGILSVIVFDSIEGRPNVRAHPARIIPGASIAGCSGLTENQRRRRKRKKATIIIPGAAFA